MPSYLDFSSTSTFRDFLISKTLQRPFGPQTFTAANYSVQTLSNLANVDPGAVDTNRANDLLQIKNTNIFKPVSYFVTENINTIPRSANLNLYPYFTRGDISSLFGIMSNSNYDNESQLMKFAALNIRENRDGPVFARITQNLTSATLGRVRLADAINGNTATAINIVTGREPLIEKNYKITVAKTLLGKGVDFLQTVAGVEFPFSEIPGDYLSNPQNPIENRPTPRTEAGAILQDVTGALGSLIGIQRRPKVSRKPSDLMIEYMGDGQKQTLFDNLSYSKYAPNYTTTARSQQSSKLFNGINQFAQGVKSLLGLEAPKGVAYIGDDRSEDVKMTMSDANNNMVKGSYYMGMMFDPVQTSLFERQRNISEGGTLSTKLTWISRNSKEYDFSPNETKIPRTSFFGERSETTYSREQTSHIDSLSTKYGFREDSILGKTQELLDSMPNDGMASRTHVGNVIDQTSRVFREGEVMLSRGSAIQYVDKYTKENTGIEYCRVWTKDRSYFNYSDTMKRTGNIRKFDDSVMSTPWNLNIAPMSDGDRNFEGVSTNIFKGPPGDGFYAKKYMFSIENLAWKTSNTPGFTYNDLPYCERGANGGRVMWFPPYDLKISEQNSARWNDNTFLGRPEPIYTYQDTSRTGTLSFKVVVDHPSILNLLVREHFKNMSDEESENYINAFFAGCEELDFYSLIRRYTYLDSDDITLIKMFLEKGKDPEVIKKYKTIIEPVVNTDQSSGSSNLNGKNEGFKCVLKYDNDIPGPRFQSVEVDTPYGQLFEPFYIQKTGHTAALDTALRSITGITQTAQVLKEREYVFGKTGTTIDNAAVLYQTNLLDGYFETAKKEYEKFTGGTATLKEMISGGTVQRIYLTVESSCSSVASELYNEKLALRRSSSIIKEFFKNISKDGTVPKEFKWVKSIGIAENKNLSENDKVIISKGKPIVIKKEYKLSDFGWTDNTGSVVIDSANYGENFTGPSPDSQCRGKEFVTVKSLKIHAPVAFFCRQSTAEVKYHIEPEKPKPTPPPTVVTRIEEDGETILYPPTKKPAIDPMKRIIMKTLSECFYFKKLEEDSPVAFKSLKEKLKYFHPGFHSTTPEGLNSRLTFMLQCIRPGDTIPIKGIADDADLNARNTSFGPPPVCVLRIGDFYHSKIIIRDVNITYDDSPWDLNPEGIGVQPMIANITCQIAFIGGQGLSRPVERLQNALSSNFFANTEMYDERSIPTNETIGGVDAKEFTKDFLEKLLSDLPKQKETPETQNTNKISEGKWIGTLSSATMDFTPLLQPVFDNTDNYFKKYESTYNKMIKRYGEDIGTLLFTDTYRTIKQYDVYTTTSTTPGKTLSLVGLYKKNNELPILMRGVKSAMIAQLDNTDLSLMFGLDKVLTPPKLAKSNEYLKPLITKIVEDKLNELIDTNPFSEFESVRDSLIKSLDYVNFLVKFGKDTMVMGEDVTDAILSGFTYDLLYNEYSSCIDYIEKNTPKMFVDLTSTINFNTPTISSIEFERIMTVFLQEKINEIVKVYENDQTIFPENIRKKIRNKIEDFVKEIKDNKFKFSNFKKRKNSKEIKFTVTTNNLSTDATFNEESKKVHSDNVEVTDKLNYYKSNKDKK
jgi:bifunctional DNA-binding transcriptional regulator/antitoxin component of YhaV-PrlF toxin-antitoxin module